MPQGLWQVGDESDDLRGSYRFQSDQEAKAALTPIHQGVKWAAALGMGQRRRCRRVALEKSTIKADGPVGLDRDAEIMSPPLCVSGSASKLSFWQRLATLSVLGTVYRVG